MRLDLRAQGFGLVAARLVDRWLAGGAALARPPHCGKDAGNKQQARLQARRTSEAKTWVGRRVGKGANEYAQLSWA